MIQSMINKTSKPCIALIISPDPKHEILLAEHAQTLATRSLILMSKLFPVKDEIRSNAADMNENNYVPLTIIKQFDTNTDELKDGMILQTYNDLCGFLKVRSQQLSKKSNAADLDCGYSPALYDFGTAQEKDTLQYFSYLQLCNNFTLIELYINWMHEPSFQKITTKRYAFNKPWPLNKLLLKQRRAQIISYLKAKGWGDKNLGNIETELSSILEALSQLLGSKNYFFSDTHPSDLDALVFGHLYTLLTTKSIDSRFQDLIHSFPTLTKFVSNIENRYFT